MRLSPDRNQRLCGAAGASPKINTQSDRLLDSQSIPPFDVGNETPRSVSLDRASARYRTLG
jgi:hypothetical protein